MRTFLLCFSLMLLTSCSAKEELPQSGVRSLSWLEGRWVASDSNGSFIEEWHDAGTMLTGRGMTINAQDTSHMEQLTIVMDTSGLISYIVDLPNGRTVRFLSRGMTATETYRNLSYSQSTIVTFANDTNSFPREITYRKQNSDSLYITLTGSEAGKPMETTLKMKKAK